MGEGRQGEALAQSQAESELAPSWTLNEHRCSQQCPGGWWAWDSWNRMDRRWRVRPVGPAPWVASVGTSVCAVQPCPKDTWDTCLCWWMCRLHTLELMEIQPCPQAWAFIVGSCRLLGEWGACGGILGQRCLFTQSWMGNPLRSSVPGGGRSGPGPEVPAIPAGFGVWCCEQ